MSQITLSLDPVDLVVLRRTLYRRGNDLHFSLLHVANEEDKELIQAELARVNSLYVYIRETLESNQESL